MKINIYVIQRHTKTGDTQEKFLEQQDIDGEKGIWQYSKLKVKGKAYQVQKLRNSPSPSELDVLCYELPNEGNPGLLKNLVM